MTPIGAGGPRHSAQSTRVRCGLLRLGIVATFVVGFVLPLPAAGLPVRPLPLGRIPVPPAPAVSAPAWILYDDTFGVTLAASHPDEVRPMASTTKIMTALVALESPPEEIVVSARAAEAGEAEIGLVAGERFTLDELLPALLVRSANDAAVAIAESAAGSVDAFVDRMNERAAELGLAHTHFTNPHGLDAPDHYSSPADLLALARRAMADPRFARAVGSPTATIRPAPDGTRRSAETTNHLLTDYVGSIGVKTGYTGRAGLVLVAAAERQGRRLYAVVMGSEGERGHVRDASALLDYGFGRMGIVPAAVIGPEWSSLGGDPSLDVEASTRAALRLAAAGLGGGEETRGLAAPRGLDPLPAPADALGWWWR